MATITREIPFYNPEPVDFRKLYNDAADLLNEMGIVPADAYDEISIAFRDQTAWVITWSDESHKWKAIA